MALKPIKTDKKFYPTKIKLKTLSPPLLKLEMTRNCMVLPLDKKKSTKDCKNKFNTTFKNSKK